MDAEEMIDRNNDYLVTETTIRAKISGDAILDHLRSRKTTGRLTFELIEGGIRRITLSEKTRAPERQRDEIRQLFGMNGNGS
ncbi:MAG: hypothetical protein C5B60_07665 [Chloroflexi bacterium]|nr:MAG: hypothetical protein C5B60_07665 [Chloroflexota bacterium]